MTEHELCLCGHEIMQHLDEGCDGDFGSCPCAQFIPESIWGGEDDGLQPA